MLLLCWLAGRCSFTGHQRCDASGVCYPLCGCCSASAASSGSIDSRLAIVGCLPFRPLLSRHLSALNTLPAISTLVAVLQCATCPARPSGAAPFPSWSSQTDPSHAIDFSVSPISSVCRFQIFSVSSLSLSRSLVCDALLRPNTNRSFSPINRAEQLCCSPLRIHALAVGNSAVVCVPSICFAVAHCHTAPQSICRFYCVHLRHHCLPAGQRHACRGHAGLPRSSSPSA